MKGLGVKVRIARWASSERRISVNIKQRERAARPLADVFFFVKSNVQLAAFVSNGHAYATGVECSTTKKCSRRLWHFLGAGKNISSAYSYRPVMREAHVNTTRETRVEPEAWIVCKYRQPGVTLELIIYVFILYATIIVLSICRISMHVCCLNVNNVSASSRKSQ